MAATPWESLAFFEDLCGFFHPDAPQEPERFRWLFDEMMRLYAERPVEVEEVWLPYALERLSRWPDEARRWEGGIDWDEQREVDRFWERSHPLYALGRSLYAESYRREHVAALLEAPDLACLADIRLGYLAEAPTPAQLWQALGARPPWGLRRLALQSDEITDEHAAVLAQCACLSTLEALDLCLHQMTPAGVRALARSPHLHGLRRLVLGDVPGTLWDQRGSGDVIGAELLGDLPALELLLEPLGTRSLRESAGPVPPPPLRPARDRVEEVIALFRDFDPTAERMTYPFTPFFRCLAGYAELDEARWRDPGLCLDEVHPAAAALFQRDDADITSLYVLCVRDGALERAFDAQGALAAPLALRMLGRTWLGPPAGREPAAYQGQCLLQSLLAEQGLSSDETAEGLLVLSPGRPPSALVRTYEAIAEAEARWGGSYIRYLCTPWHDPTNGQEEAAWMRGSIVWAEHEHAFDARGELPPGAAQPLRVIGDPIPLIRMLARRGLHLSVRGERGRLSSAVPCA